MVSVTFKKQGDDTLMTLVHSRVPDTDSGRSYEKAWNYFLGLLSEKCGSVSRTNQ